MSFIEKTILRFNYAFDKYVFTVFTLRFFHLDKTIILAQCVNMVVSKVNVIR